MDLKDTHGWRCSVRNGPCSVSFNENSQSYEAHVRLVGTTFSAYGGDPVRAFELAVGGMTTYFNRLSAERDAILQIHFRLDAAERAVAS